MLKGNLFTIDTIAHSEGIVDAAITINAGSDIFKGHFPGQPVLPGACMLQIIKDVLQDGLGQQIILKKAQSIKFLIQIDPAVTDQLQISISYKAVGDMIDIIAMMMAGDDLCLKLKAGFTKLT